MAKVIILCGQENSGKNDIAYHLNERNFQLYSIKETLQRELYKEYGYYQIENVEREDEPIKELPVFDNGRDDDLLPLFGTIDRNIYWTPRTLFIHERRNKNIVDPAYWIRKCLTEDLYDHRKHTEPSNEVKIDLDKGNFYVFTGVHYKEEIEFIKSVFNGPDCEVHVWKVKREQSDDEDSHRYPSDLDAYPANHTIMYNNKDVFEKIDNDLRVKIFNV